MVDVKALETSWKLCKLASSLFSFSSSQIYFILISAFYRPADKPAASELAQWVSRLSMELLHQSPSPVLRQCASLKKHVCNYT